MRRSLSALLFVLPFLTALDANALRLGNQTVIIPVIGRFPGVGGTQWQTDVFISNPFSTEIQVKLHFYPSGEASVVEREVTMTPFSSLTLTDICLTLFGRSNTGGMLEVISLQTIDARARIYNVGNAAGQFGQNVPGIGAIFLNRQAYLFGLNATTANRLNVGVSNPNDDTVVVTIVVRDADGNLLHSREAIVEPHKNVQYNDIAATFGFARQEGINIDMNAAVPIYGYASEVRQDTGDAIFVFGLSPNS
ncbi:MAG TPA: hypothetical protein VEK79_19675 [Thermoanaerobaculia bacterium]|nr:hypothetical protein [Thermoanaerobaculia bacterium]